MEKEIILLIVLVAILLLSSGIILWKVNKDAAKDKAREESDIDY